MARSYNKVSCILGLIGFVLLAIARTGTAIHCWECNSRYDPDCRDPFNNHSIALTDCDQKQFVIPPTQKATICRKIVQKISDEYRYIRSCGYMKEDNLKEGQDCIKRAGTFHVQVQYCQCDTDGCNSGPLLSADGKLTAALLAGAVLLLARFKRGPE